MDDEADVRREFAKVLAPLGFAIDTAACVKEALALARRVGYGVVVTDFHFGEGLPNGGDLVHELRPHLPDASCVLVTGYGDQALRAIGASEHFTGVVLKPWDRDELVAAVQQAMEIHWRRTRRPEDVRVLLVEDNPADARMVSLLLEEISSVPYTVVHVSRLADAIARLQSGEFSVALADLGLPDARGLDSLRQLHARAPDLPIVAVTGLRDEALAAQALAVGAQDYLCKGELGAAALERAIGQAIERKKSEQRISYLAHHDHLTGLVNRSVFRERLVHSLARARRTGERLAVVFAGVDRFKAINDRLGHLMADRVLEAIAGRLRGDAQTFETVARLSGDEFGVLLERVDEGDAARVAERLVAALAAPIELPSGVVQVSASLGIAAYPADGDTAAELLRAADVAMYRAKQSGRSNYQLHSRRPRPLTARGSGLEASLPGAFERGEMELHYQPQYNLQTRELVGFEALARWNHPRLGEVSAADFVPLLDRAGLVSALVRWTLRNASAQLGRWRKSGFQDLRMCVNVLGGQLERADFVDEVFDALESAGLPPRCLELELTEQSLMDDPPLAARALQRLREGGVRVAVDDFGTGYSSIAHLRRFPIDAIKIDRTFLADVVGGGRAANLCRSMIGLGHGLGVEVVAEGIERGAELAFIRDSGCDRVQGFLCGRPVPRDRISYVSPRLIA